MSRRYPPAVNAETALSLSDVASGLDRNRLEAVVNAVKRDQAKLVLVAQRTQQAQALSTLRNLFSLYRACQVIEAAERIRQALAPLLDEAELAILDEVVRSYLSALLDRQGWANQAVFAWFYLKGEG